MQENISALSPSVLGNLYGGSRKLILAVSGSEQGGKDKRGQIAKVCFMQTSGALANHLDYIRKCDGRITHSISVSSRTKDRDKRGTGKALVRLPGEIHHLRSKNITK